MKKLIILLTLVASSAANATMCGYPPFPPFGMEYVCVCDRNGANCHWILVSKR